MSDAGEETKAAAVPQEPLNLDTALEEVIQISKINDGLVHGLNEVVKALDRDEAELCLLAADCQEDKYKKLVSAFAHQNKIPLIEIPKRDTLGEWVGYHKLDEDGNKRKVKGVSSVVIKSWGTTGAAYDFVQDHIKSQA